MIEFNPDGSIKLPDKLQQAQKEKEVKMSSQRAITIRRQVVNFTAPKECKVYLKLSEKMSDDRFVQTLFDEVKKHAQTPLSLGKAEGEFVVTVGTSFRRCSECQKLRAKYREFLEGNVIDEKGNCTYEGRSQSFAYEDYFD